MLTFWQYSCKAVSLWATDFAPTLSCDLSAGFPVPVPAEPFLTPFCGHCSDFSSERARTATHRHQAAAAQLTASTLYLIVEGLPLLWCQEPSRQWAVGHQHLRCTGQSPCSVLTAGETQRYPRVRTPAHLTD